MKKVNIKKLPSIFHPFIEQVREYADILNVRVYLVGGVVRDVILGREHFDLDIVVVGDALKFVEGLSKRMKLSFRRHHAFGTATVYLNSYKVDFATARSEYYPYWGALPKVKAASLKEDLFRRDFTINAMAVGLNHDDYGVLVDYYGGYQDLKDGVIRVMHEKSFLEDPTRILRAIRFEQRFRFRIERNTMRYLKEANQKKALNFIDEQRIHNELMLIMSEDDPARYIRRINNLIGFYYIKEGFYLNREDLILCRRIYRTLKWFDSTYPHHRKVNAEIIYLTVLFYRFSVNEFSLLSNNYGLNRTTRSIITSVIKMKDKISKSLSRPDLSDSYIYTMLKPLSFETILFIYSYSTDRNLRLNIRHFLSSLCNIKLKIKGKDLKEKGLEPQCLYGKVLEDVLLVKIKKNLSTREEELREAGRIIRKLAKK